MTSDSLMPRSESFNARVRGASHIDFKTSTTGVAAKAMRNELSGLVHTVKDHDTRNVRPSYISSFSHIVEVFRHKAFNTEMQNFFDLFTRYLSDRAHRKELCVHRDFKLTASIMTSLH